MILNWEALLYILGGLVILFLYRQRIQGLPKLTPESLPEVDRASFLALKALLESAYQRMLFLALSLLLLAAATVLQWDLDIKAFFMLSTLIIFVANMFPRHKLMKLLLGLEIPVERLKEIGIRL